MNNIEPGTSSERRAFETGDIEFTMSIQGVNDDIVMFFIQIIAMIIPLQLILTIP